MCQFLFNASHELTVLVPPSRDLEEHCCVGTACLYIIENRIGTNLYSKKLIRGIH